MGKTAQNRAQSGNFPIITLVLQKNMNNEIEWGLVACGRSGETSIDIDESISGPEIYEFEISKAKWNLRFRISNTKVIIDLLDFIKNNVGLEFHLGIFNGIKVNLSRDSEFSDRFFLKINGQSGIMHYEINGGSEINELIDALEQIIEDL